MEQTGSQYACHAILSSNKLTSDVVLEHLAWTDICFVPNNFPVIDSVGVCDNAVQLQHFKKFHERDCKQMRANYLC